MSDSYCAWIRIGGKIEIARAGPLIQAINESGVSTEWGAEPFVPKKARDLLKARDEDWIWLCDTEASYGEFPEIEKACRELSLGYRSHCEAWCSQDAQIADWRPGMKKPLVRTASTSEIDVVFVDVDLVAEALSQIESGRTKQGIVKLRKLCPQFPDLPPFEIV